MNLPSLEKRRLRLSKGVLPSPHISNLASCHPFTKQIDVVFPSNSALLNVLQGVESTYAKGKTTLLELYENTDKFVVDGGSRLLILSDDALSEDCWCIDYRGLLTLCVGKDTYERAGLVGKRLPFKGFEDRHVIEIGLQKSAHTPAQQARFKEAFKVLDLIRRESLGSGNTDWDVLYCAVDHFVALDEANLFREQSLIKIAGRQRKMDVDGGDDFDSDDKEETEGQRIQSFFEWVGMACMGSQRLYANDSVDPYVALYEPPEPSSVGSLTHLRWTGLVSPKLVELIVRRVTEPSSPDFVSVTSLAYTQSPVSYIAHMKGPSGAAASNSPLKLPRRNGEDTWSLVFEPGVKSGEQGKVERKWDMMKCIGQWDMRLG
ncbi:hypothetical protein BJ165DRAFT_395325 [Panaeolus papilionaceus]|nr:hypothetical protein BJ165DRAFT_395325 [Panaeolus papilionaceus]